MFCPVLSSSNPSWETPGMRSKGWICELTVQLDESGEARVAAEYCVYVV